MKISKLHKTIDADVWAKEWMKVVKKNPSIPTDEACMIGWFANAIMAGYDAAYNKHTEPFKGDPHTHAYKDMKAGCKVASRKRYEPNS